MKNKILFYFTMFISALGLSSTAVAYDNDLWARLIVGKLFFLNGHILKNDFLSYTPTHTWWDHEWGASIIFYYIYDKLGHFGLLLLHALLIFLTFFVIQKIIQLRNNTLTNTHNIIFFFLTLNVFYIAVKSPVRCQMFSFLFFSIFLYLLEKYRLTLNKKLLIYFPIITLFWANIHGGIIAGLGILFLYTIGEFLNKKPIKPYLITLLVSFLTMFINPYGIEYVLFLLYANTMKRPAIIEWWPIWHKVIWKSYLLFDFWAIFSFITAVITLVKNKFKNIDFTKYIVLVVVFFEAIIHVKLIPLAVIVSCVFLYEDIIRLFNKIELNKTTYAIIYTLIITTFITSINPSMFKPILTWSIYPYREVEFIKQNKIEGNIFTSFGYGSFVSYKLYPQNKIYMDGRYEEVYYNETLNDMETLYVMKEGWDNVLKKYPTDILLVERNSVLYKYISKYSDWTKIFDGYICGIFVKKDKVKQNYIMPSTDQEYYRKNLFNSEINYYE